MTKSQKFLLAAGFCCLMAAPSMFATSFDAICGVNDFGTGGIGSPVGVACGGVSLPAGSTITGVEIFVTGDMDLALSGTPVSTFTFAANGITTQTCTATPGVQSCGTFAGNLTTPGITELFVSAGFWAADLSGFTVTVTNSVTGGTAHDTASLVIEQFDYTLPGGVPEPATFVLMGAGLGLVGLLRRKAVRR